MKEVLRTHIEKLVSFTDEEFAAVAACFQEHTCRKREFLFREGDRVNDVWFVVSGLLCTIYNDDTGHEHVVSFAMEDWWETDFQAYYTRSRASFSIQCLEDSRLLSLSLESYLLLRSRLPKIERFFLEKSIAGGIAAQQRIISFLTANAAQRYELLLSRYPSLMQRVPKTLLASYLGVSRETLSRLGS